LNKVPEEEYSLIHLFWHKLYLSQDWSLRL